MVAVKRRTAKRKVIARVLVDRSTCEHRAAWKDAEVNNVGLVNVECVRCGKMGMVTLTHDMVEWI